MQNEQSREAADLLLQRYPFQWRCACQPDFNGATGVSAGKSSLPGNAGKGGDFIEKPLPLAEQRQWQSQLPGIADNCPAIVRLLGDMSPSYDAAA